MLSTCLAKMRDPQKALPLSRLAWFSRLFYIYRVLYFLCFFPLYRVVLTVYVREELGCRFYWLFALLSATVCGSLGLCFFFSFYSLSYAFDMLRLLILPLGFFTLGAFWLFSVTVLRPLFFLLCTLWLNIFFLFAWGPTHRSHGFHTFFACASVSYFM